MNTQTKTVEQEADELAEKAVQELLLSAGCAMKYDSQQNIMTTLSLDEKKWLKSRLPELIAQVEGTLIFCHIEMRGHVRFFGNDVTDHEWPSLVRAVEGQLTPAQLIQYTEFLTEDLHIIEHGYYPGEETINLDDISKLVLLNDHQRIAALRVVLK